MKKIYQIVYEDKPEDSAWGIIGRGVSSYNIEQAGEEKFQRICFVLKDPEGEIAGGILGDIYWNWFYIDLLWVKEELRGQGFGRSLLAQAEERARRQGAGNVYLDTFSFQAPDFYKQSGYEVFGELPDFPAGHTRFFMTKKI
ncbi:MAG: GNAT family N-acetyltransferase [Candidatus Promineifilaceae bacterium]